MRKTFYSCRGYDRSGGVDDMVARVAISVAMEEVDAIVLMWCMFHDIKLEPALQVFVSHGSLALW